MTIPHDHLGNHLTAGCPACIAHVEAERWRTAPRRVVTWTWTVGAGDGKTRYVKSVATVRVPDGATPDEVDEAYMGESVTGIPDADSEAVAIEVSHGQYPRVEIGALVDVPVDAGEQGSLL